MNLRRLPILPTVIVLAAVIVMAMLGFWQLDRMKQKEALLARYASSEGQTAESPGPPMPPPRRTCCSAAAGSIAVRKGRPSR